MFDVSRYGWDTIYLTTVKLDAAVEKGWHVISGIYLSY